MLTGLPSATGLGINSLGSGIFPCTWAIAANWQGEEKRGQTEHAAVGTHLCTMCQHCWVQGINHSAVWHGACWCRSCAEQWVLWALRHGVSSWSSHSTFRLEGIADCASSCWGLSHVYASFPHVGQGVLTACRHQVCHHFSSLELCQENPIHLKLHPSPLSLFRNQAWSPRRFGHLRTEKDKPEGREIGGMWISDNKGSASQCF